MDVNEPVTELDADFSGSGATPTPWGVARRAMEQAELFWVSTVRPDGRPHVTPLLGVWNDGALHFCTGATERKARNLERNRRCVMTTGPNAFGGGLHVVLEGSAEAVTDAGTLRVLADAWESKYGAEWRFEVADGSFVQGGHSALVFAIAPTKVFSYSNDEPGAATRYRF